MSAGAAGMGRVSASDKSPRDTKQHHTTVEDAGDAMERRLPGGLSYLGTPFIFFPCVPSSVCSQQSTRSAH